LTAAGGRVTEATHPATTDIDRRSPAEIVGLILAEEATVAQVVAAEGPRIAALAEVCAARLEAGGRLIYAGAGTSGRLGALDAAELPPTFGTDPGQVVALLAGGPAALTASVEAAEDRAEDGAAGIAALGGNARDVVLGVAASGRTPFVLGALREARSLGAFTAALTCVRASELASLADLAIQLVVGPEVISGSTRLKAGTATKLALNALSTTTMILLGKTYGNLMVDMRATNEKLRDRAARIVAEATGLSGEEAARLLAEAGGEQKVAIVMALAGCDPATARSRLSAAGGRVRAALELPR
jgi:N-acetylmuramic acid 6-phosphate etherase